ncbi:MAG: YqeG family HAD IIIA-type phosphatase [Ruminococcaceae bacterium]|nr:YqeG family HAD IIIA-type phosphatase [Oscillospiraceae bacterium]
MKKYASISNFFTPDHMFRSFDEVTPEFLHSIGINALLIDIDNTLAPYEQPDANERIINWFKTLKDAGIKAALISNNHPPRVERFNKKLGLIAYADCGKPKSRMLLVAMEQMGSTISDTAGLGDQILTDTAAAHNLGLPSIIVPPIKDKTNAFYKVKRAIERPFVKKYRKKNHGDGSFPKWPKY